MGDGDYAIQLKNMKLTETDISMYYEHELVETTMTIGETTGIGASLIDNGQLTIDNSVYNLAGLRIAAPQKGVYVVGGKKIVMRSFSRNVTLIKAERFPHDIGTVPS